MLAAWLSALKHNEAQIGSLITEFQLEDFLGPTANPDDIGPRILNLIQTYQSLRAQDLNAAAKTDVTKFYLQETWPHAAEERSVLNRFIRILDDEKFMLSLQAPVGKILIVDPAEAVSPVMTTPLQNQGYFVLAVGSVPSAEQVFAKELPDVVLAEMNIPVEDGLDLCRKMKASPGTSGIPLLIMTSSKSTRVHRECVKAGADDVFLRPIDMELLSIKLHRLLESKQAARPAGGLTGSLKDIQLSDVVQILCAGMKDVKLTLSSGGQEGAIYITGGEIVDVEAGELRGEPAFYRLMKWKEGTFASQPCEEFPSRTIELPAMSLLMEAARRLDEGVAEGEASGPEINR